MKTRIRKRDKHITRQIHRLFWEANLQDKRTLIIAYLFRFPSFVITNSLLPVATAFGVKAILDHNINDVYMYSWMVIWLSIIAAACQAIGSVAVSKNAVIGSEYIQNKIFSNFLEKDYDFYSSQFVGSLGAQVTRLRDMYNNYGELVTFQLPKQLSIVVASFVIVAVQSLQLAFVTLAAMVIVLGFIFVSGKWRVPYRRRVSEASSVIAGHIGDALSHGTTVKSFATESLELERLQVPLKDWGKKQYKSWLLFVPPDGIRWLLAATATAILLIMSAQLYDNGSISTAIVVLIQLYVIRLIASSMEIAQMVKNYEEMMGNAYEPVKTMLIASKIQDPEQPRRLSKRKTHTLELDHVSFTYPEARKSQTALKDFSLAIKPGEKIGIVGYSGSGKTTLTKLLLRFMDVTKGGITLDGINIRELSQHDLRAAISYVPQEPLLFHRTIAENIGYGLARSTQATIRKAAKLAYVDEFTQELPAGYETLVGERGVKLSGGQRQRVAIARALLKDAPVLVLDEATSALDSRSEKYIQDALWELMKGRTAIVIAHRLSTIQRMDRIVVLDKGRIVQIGTHAELKKQSGIYAGLWAHQSGGYIGTPTEETD